MTVQAKLYATVRLILDVNHALRAPFTGPVLAHFQFRIGCPLDLRRGLVAGDIDGFPASDGVEAGAIEPDAETAEQHAAGRHLVDQRVEPVDEQQFKVGCFTLDGHRFPAAYRVRVGDDRRECNRRFLEGRFPAAAASQYTDIGLVMEVLPHDRQLAVLPEYSYCLIFLIFFQE